MQKTIDYGQVVTKNVFHTAYLVTCGMSIKNIEYDKEASRAKVIFIVEGKDIARYEQQYRSGKVTVNLFALQEAVKDVKDVMFNFLRSRDYSISSGTY